jgi:hypothetical protein
MSPVVTIIGRQKGMSLDEYDVYIICIYIYARMYTYTYIAAEPHEDGTIQFSWFNRAERFTMGQQKTSQTGTEKPRVSEIASCFLRAPKFRSQSENTSLRIFF